MEARPAIHRAAWSHIWRPSRDPLDGFLTSSVAPGLDRPELAPDRLGAALMLAMLLDEAFCGAEVDRGGPA